MFTAIDVVFPELSKFFGRLLFAIA